MKIEQYSDCKGLTPCKICDGNYVSYFLERIGEMWVPTFKCSNCGAKVSRESKKLAFKAWNSGEVVQP